MLRSLSLMVLLSISSLVAKSSAAIKLEADQKAQALTTPFQHPSRPSALALARSIPANPYAFTDKELTESAPWVMKSDNETVTLSHALRKGKVVREIPLFRTFFRTKPAREQWYRKNIGAHRRLFEDQE